MTDVFDLSTLNTFDSTCVTDDMFDISDLDIFKPTDTTMTNAFDSADTTVSSSTGYDHRPLTRDEMVSAFINIMVSAGHFPFNRKCLVTAPSGEQIEVYLDFHIKPKRSNNMLSPLDSGVPISPATDEILTGTEDSAFFCDE